MSKLFGKDLELEYNSAAAENTFMEDAKPVISDNKGMLWETSIPMDEDDKGMYSYKHHLERLTCDGWDRAPLPQETLSLYFSCNLDKGHKPENHIWHGMKYGIGEFSCNGIQRFGKKVHIYQNMRDINIDTMTMTYRSASGSWFDIMKTFHMLRYTRRDEYTIEDLYWDCPHLVEELIDQRWYKQKELLDKVRIILPDDNYLWPIGFNDNMHKDGVKIMPRIRAASRGVRMKR